MQLNYLLTWDEFFFLLRKLLIFMAFIEVSSHHWFTIDSLLIHSQFTIDSLVIHSQFILDSFLIHSRFILPQSCSSFNLKRYKSKWVLSLDRRSFRLKECVAVMMMIQEEKLDNIKYNEVQQYLISHRDICPKRLWASFGQLFNLALLYNNSQFHQRSMQSNPKNTLTLMQP